MSEIHAAMGLSCFAVLDELLAKNKTHYQHYRDRLSNLPGLRFLDYDKVEQCNHQYIVIEIDAKQSPVDRDTLMARLHQAGIRSRRYFYPGCHRMQPYASLYPERLNSLPETDALCARVIILPSGASLATEDIDRVCTTIESSLT